MRFIRASGGNRSEELLERRLFPSLPVEEIIGNVWLPGFRFPGFHAFASGFLGEFPCRYQMTKGQAFNQKFFATIPFRAGSFPGIRAENS